MSCTDYATSRDFDPPFDSPHLLDLEGLRQAVQLIARLRQEERDSVVDDTDQICSSRDNSYG